MSYQPPSNPNDPTYTPTQPYTQYAPPPPQGYPPYQQPPKRKRRVWLWIVIIVALIVVYQIGHAAITEPTNSTPVATLAPATEQPTTPPTVAVLTNVDEIKAEIKNDANGVLTGDAIVSDYSEQESRAIILESTANKRPLSFVQDECFNMQKTIWQDPLLSVQSVDFAIAIIRNGAAVVYGECILNSSNAGKIDWGNTDAATAWNDKVYQDMTP